MWTFVFGKVRVGPRMQWIGMSDYLPTEGTQILRKRARKEMYEIRIPSTTFLYVHVHDSF